jgi:hypothetical protein
LVLLFYTNPYLFEGEAGVEFSNAAVSGAANYLTPLFKQGDIPDKPGFEGYPAGFAIHDWDGDGIPEWDRFVVVPSYFGKLRVPKVDPLFRAEWDTTSTPGTAIETFPFDADVNVSVYLKPVYGGRGLSLTSDTISISRDGVSTGPMKLPGGAHIEFETTRTGPTSITTVGTFYDAPGTKKGSVVGKITLKLVYSPGSSYIPPTPYRVP